MNSKPALAAALLGGFVLLAVTPVRASLTYESIDGTDLIYDSVTDITWTRDANISGETFTWQDAQNWAANLSLAGFGPSDWVLPTADQFTSLYNQLDGMGDKYGTQVFFGSGTNDFAGNVQPEYWTDTDGTDFNFYYGYPGSRPDSDLYPVWAVTAVPEPSAIYYGLLAGGLVLARRRVK